MFDLSAAVWHINCMQGNKVAANRGKLDVVVLQVLVLRLLTGRIAVALSPIA